MKHLAALVGATLMVAAGVAVAAEAGGEHKITICHASGLAGTTKYETLTIDDNAVYGPAGHFNNDGTPQAGHEQDYFGPCEGDTTDTTPTTPTDTVPTTPTTTNPPHTVVGTASVICDNHIYKVSGTVDGQQADSVNPSTLPGSTKGVTNVTVTRGDTSVRTTVTTLGDCAPTVIPPAAVPPATTTAPSTTTTTPVASVPPKAKPKPKAPKPAAKPKPAPKATPKPHKPAPHVCATLADGTKRAWWHGGNGMPAGCYAVIQGSG